MSSALSEHEYEPIASPPSAASAPVVRITDTDVVPVADSDESIDANERCFPPKLTLDGDVVLPLDGQIEDNAMDGRELGETVDTSEDQETTQQMQDRLEERFLNAATPCTESRTDCEVNTSQVDSSALEELPLRRGARGLPQRLRSQAGKLRSRLRGIQRPTFSLPERQKPEKTKTIKVEKPKPVKTEKSKFSLPDRSKFSLPDRPKFNFPERPKFNFPERPKFNLPERPKFNFPERAKFSMPERPKFNIKRPNINLPNFGRMRRPLRERQQSTESTTGSKRSVLDFATYPRIFDKKKNRGEYATSSPKDSRVESTDSATFPRVKKRSSIGVNLSQRFTDIKFADDEPESVTERAKPWRHPSLEEPRLSLRHESLDEPERLPWEESEEHSNGNVDNAKYEQDSAEMRYHIPETEEAYIIQAADLHEHLKPAEDSYDEEPEKIDARLYRDQSAVHPSQFKEKGHSLDKDDDEIESTKWKEEPDDEPDVDSYNKQEESIEMTHEELYGRPFMPIDPRKYQVRIPSPEQASIHSDREQQSSGSSSDRRRRGVLEEIDSDEFFLRAKGISQDDMNVGRFLADEIRDAFRPTANALANENFPPSPPTRPTRTRSLRKRKDDSIESYNTLPPARPKRDRRRSEESDYNNYYPDKAGSISGSRHRIIYQTEGIPHSAEPLDDIVIVKPERRKSRSTLRSYTELPTETLPSAELGPIVAPTPPTPPVAPRRRKRGHRVIEPEYQNGTETAVCNGHRDWHERSRYPAEVTNYSPEVMNYPPEIHDIMPDEPDLRQETLQSLVMQIEQEYIEPAPVAPKRLSRSRATSVADDDRTSHGAESLPEGGYIEDDIPRDTDSRDLPGYAIIEKREKPPRPPPPRRRRDKFATTPRPSVPSVPTRPLRAYSTLGHPHTQSLPDTQLSVNPLDVTPYTELDSDDAELRDLRSGDVLSKMQGRPLPAPPRPPRARREQTDQTSMGSNGVVEVAVSTQTDPLPDDMIIEEEITQAKLVMAPSRSGSQILVSTERIPTPTHRPSSPFIPPQAQSPQSERFTPSPTIGRTSSPVNKELSVPRETEDSSNIRPSVSPIQLTHSSLQSEPLRIANLEVADLRVDRLTVSQLETHKVSASEIDAVVVSASEISSIAGLGETGLHPTLLRELMAIRSHLESVASNQIAQELTQETTKKAESTSLSTTGRLTDSQTQREIKQEICTESSKNLIEQAQTSPAVEDAIGAALAPEINLESQKISASTEPEIDEPNIKMESPTLEVTEPKIIVDTQTEDTLGSNEETPEHLQSEFLRAHNLTPDPESKVEETHATISSPISTPNQSLPSLTSQQDLTEQTQTVQISDKPFTIQETTGGRTTQAEDRNADEKESFEGKSSRASSRSRSTSPSNNTNRPVRQTASPLRSLPPVISVTPDSNTSQVVHTEVQPQRAVVSYSRDSEERSQREHSQSSQPSLPPGATQFIAFPSSQIPAHFFSLGSPVSSRFETEPSIADMTQQLLRALRVAGTRAMRHFVGYISSKVSSEQPGEKTREVELALCALLLLIAGLLILCFGSPRTITHHHHWDYFNPPQ